MARRWQTSPARSLARVMRARPRFAPTRPMNLANSWPKRRKCRASCCDSRLAGHWFARLSFSTLDRSPHFQSGLMLRAFRRHLRWCTLQKAALGNGMGRSSRSDGTGSDDAVGRHSHFHKSTSFFCRFRAWNSPCRRPADGRADYFINLDEGAMKANTRTFAMAALASALATATWAQELGRVHFQTSCTPQAQEKFDRGLALVHSFFYPDSVQAFTEAAAADPQCAIAYWGIAISHRPNPLILPLTAAALKNGLEAAEKGKTIGAKTERERD